MKKNMLLTAVLLCFGLLGTQSLQAKTITITLKAKDIKGISRLIIETKDGSELKNIPDWGGVIRETSFKIEESKKFILKIRAIFDTVWTEDRFSKTIKAPKKNTTYDVIDKGNWKFEIKKAK